jgi:uncharacterized membrane protein YbjE (DUF340 family)
MSIFEAGMLICFGAAWPVNIYKSYKTKSAVGKSLPFLLIVITGYCCGIIHKLLFSRDVVLYLYLLNLLMVFVDLALYVRNRRLDREKLRLRDNLQGCE